MNNNTNRRNRHLPPAIDAVPEATARALLRIYADVNLVDREGNTVSGLHPEDVDRVYDNRRRTTASGDVVHSERTNRTRPAMRNRANLYMR